MTTAPVTVAAAADAAAVELLHAVHVRRPVSKGICLLKPALFLYVGLRCYRPSACMMRRVFSCLGSRSICTVTSAAAVYSSERLV